ncbi:hypothetical protein ACFWYW_39450 [Nonomuraea sp. NPDC059023]|uniref:hypothetical protein n=1 Tax=unclassified Nonomuraea TaxID=2593643 RepID=UPI0036A4B6BF
MSPFLLTLRLVPAALILAACAPNDDRGQETRTPPTRAVPSTASTSPPPPPSDGYNEFEVALMTLLRDLGVRSPGVFEHGFQEAWISGEWKNRRILVHQYTKPAKRGTPGPVIDEGKIGGVPIQIVHTKPFGPLIRFRCKGLGYDVTSLSADLKPGSGHRRVAESFARTLVPKVC